MPEDVDMTKKWNKVLYPERNIGDLVTARIHYHHGHRIPPTFSEPKSGRIIKKYAPKKDEDYGWLYEVQFDSGEVVSNYTSAAFKPYEKK